MAGSVEREKKKTAEFSRPWSDVAGRIQLVNLFVRLFFPLATGACTPNEILSLLNLICLAFPFSRMEFHHLRTGWNCVTHHWMLIATTRNRRYWYNRSCWRFINKCDSCKFGRSMGSADWKSWSFLVYWRSGKLSYAFNVAEHSQGIQSEIIWVSDSACYAIQALDISICQHWNFALIWDGERYYRIVKRN